uniref:Uncharacterized protein n=1 Tax=Octopus bimaculoides TaxID=37653 RepID=A0A0L8FMF7_OCTBM
MEDLKEKISPLLKPRDLFSTLVGAHPILAPDTDSSPKQSTTTDSKNDYVPNSNVTHNTCGNVTNTAGNLENGSTNLQFGYANNINIK